MVVALAALLTGLGLMVGAGGRHHRNQARAMEDLLGMALVSVERRHDDELSAVADRAVDLAGQVVEHVDRAHALRVALERARIPLRPGEFVIVVTGGCLGIAALTIFVTHSVVLAAATAASASVLAARLLKRRVTKRRRAFEAQLPDALSLVASSLTAGHTFLRAIQMMCQESGPPMSEEFARVVTETNLGDAVVDALGRMAARLQIRDLDMVVQAIRIQQSVGGRLSELLHTLADVIRARDEVRLGPRPAHLLRVVSPGRHVHHPPHGEDRGLMNGSLLACIVVALLGAAVMAATWARSRRVAPDFGEFMENLDYEDDAQSILAQPFLPRLLGGARRALAARLVRLVPANHLDKIGRQLAQAGLATKRRAGEQLAMQLVLAAAGLALVPMVPAGTPLKRLLALVLLPVMGFTLPAARLKRAIRTRSEAIFKDLPDIVDMLAVSVEAGCGFEAALSLVCQNFHSPLTDELSLALHEMELGLSRKEAFQQLRERVDLDAVRTLVLSLLQADALGIPISRVLKSQATEVRARRRAWAREKAAKLPVKIMFPLVLFIFPPIMALVLGPAMSSFSHM